MELVDMINLFSNTGVTIAVLGFFCWKDVQKDKNDVEIQKSFIKVVEKFCTIVEGMSTTYENQTKILERLLEKL